MRDEGRKTNTQGYRPLGLDWIRNLEEVGNPVLEDLLRVKQLYAHERETQKRFRDAKRALLRDIHRLWSEMEIRKAKEEGGAR